MTVEKSLAELRVSDFEPAGGDALDSLSFRTRVAVLWLTVAVALLGSMLLFLYVPGVVEEMLAGEAEGEPLTEAVGFQLAMFLIIPVVMAAVTLLVRDRVNRYVNLIIGMTYGLFGGYMVVSEIAGGHFDAHVLMAIVASVLALLIAALGLIGLRQSTDRTSLRA